ncbi:MAG: shikimate kinase [Planctomycetes bacterium]|nr:shikimate kinase [Planctomycetota bacterium]
MPPSLPFSSGQPAIIFLIGYRGTGKTTVGRLLAQRLGWNWIDADEALEARHGRSIRRIFAEEGESGFRDKEAALVAELGHGSQQVIATGGGVVLRPENRRSLRQAGFVVWLTADVDTLWQRLQGDETTPERRPALTVGGRAEIEELLRVREPLYRACAHVVVDTTRQTSEEVADRILTQLQQFC